MSPARGSVPSVATRFIKKRLFRLLPTYTAVEIDTFRRKTTRQSLKTRKSPVCSFELSIFKSQTKDFLNISRAASFAWSIDPF